MNKLTLGLLVFFVMLLIIFAYPRFNKQPTQTFQTATVSPTPTTEKYLYDQSTDLKKELESINPQILDSDFE